VLLCSYSKQHKLTGYSTPVACLLYATCKINEKLRVALKQDSSDIGSWFTLKTGWSLGMLIHQCGVIRQPHSYGASSSYDLQWVKKLFQCLASLKRLTCYKSNKLHNNLKIIYIILYYLGFWISPRSCDLDKNWCNGM
jgi:hypothetical protein